MDILLSLFKAGDIGCVHRKPPYGLMGIPAPIIRRLTKSYYNHNFFVAEFFGELWVFEAFDKGFFPTERLSEYIKTIGTQREVAIVRPKETTQSLEESYKNLIEMVGHNYDFPGLIDQAKYQIQQEVHYQISKILSKNIANAFIKPRWTGKEHYEADKLIYCSEAIGEIYPKVFPEPWKLTPGEVFYSDKVEVVYESNIKAREHFEKVHPRRILQ